MEPDDSSTGETDRVATEPQAGRKHAVRPSAVLGDRYELGRVLGAGGVGRVFEALDRVLGEPVALKVLREDRADDHGWVRRLAREVKVARLIRHANVCRVFELGNDGGHWFVTMELAD